MSTSCRLSCKAVFVQKVVDTDLMARELTGTPSACVSVCCDVHFVLSNEVSVPLIRTFSIFMRGGSKFVRLLVRNSVSMKFNTEHEE